MKTKLFQRFLYLDNGRFSLTLFAIIIIFVVALTNNIRGLGLVLTLLVMAGSIHLANMLRCYLLKRRCRRE